MSIPWQPIKFVQLNTAHFLLLNGLCLSNCKVNIAFTFIPSPIMPMEIQYQVHGHITRIMNTFNLTIQKGMHTVIKQCLTCNERKQITFMIVQQCIHCVIMLQSVLF